MKKVLSASALVLGVMGSGVASAAEEVNVYSYRQPFLIEPMLNEFTKETGIKVNIKFAKKGMAEKVEQEGEYSPADVLLTVDISRLMELVNKDLVQSVDSETIEENVPSQYRDSDDRWFALTTRSRAVYSSRDRVGQLGEEFDYMDLAKLNSKEKSVLAQVNTHTMSHWFLPLSPITVKQRQKRGWKA